MASLNGPSPVTASWRFVALPVALVLLNGLFTFHNVWPTAFIHWPGELSVELSALLLLLALIQRWRAAVPRWLLVWLAAASVIGVLGRYGEVTAPALYGRAVNLYWDLPHVASLAGMLERVLKPWQLLLSFALVVLLLGSMYLAAFWAWRQVATSMRSPRTNAVIATIASLLTVWFVLQRMDERVPRVPRFSIPVAYTYGNQFIQVAEAVTNKGAVGNLPASPKLTSTLSLIEGADVTLMFIESYGQVTYARPEFATVLASDRSRLLAAIRAQGGDAVSAFVESPTFAGGSWLAHISFLTGIEVRDGAMAERLMTQSRENFGTALARHGYRRVALMPGLKSQWPEGAFYDFDRIYDDAAMQYDGPAFGWWRIPDQFSLARLDVLERVQARPERAPLFTFFPTISTHTPFRPTPPYQPDWSRILSAAPFDAPDLERSMAQSAEWSNMGSGYLGAVRYIMNTLTGYVQQRLDHDWVLIIIGDHQPPAMVSGEGASWNVPVHVIAARPELLDALRRHGFTTGLDPSTNLGPMHTLAPLLLAAFENQ